MRSPRRPCRHRARPGPQTDWQRSLHRGHGGWRAHPFVYWVWCAGRIVAAPVLALARSWLFWLLLVCAVLVLIDVY